LAGEDDAPRADDGDLGHEQISLNKIQSEVYHLDAPMAQAYDTPTRAFYKVLGQREGFFAAVSAARVDRIGSLVLYSLKLVYMLLYFAGPRRLRLPEARGIGLASPAGGMVCAS
jgi:hypothetical protein